MMLVLATLVALNLGADDDVQVRDLPGENWPVFFQHGARLEEPDFYRAINHPELAEAYVTRQTLRIALLSGGAVAAVTGGIIFALNYRFGVCTKYSGSVQDRGLCLASQPERAIAGGLTAALGLLSMIIGGSIAQHPISADDSVMLMERFNLSLKNLKVGWSLDASGAGLQLSGSF